MDAREPDRLYEQFVKPLEGRHWGEYAGVSFEGEVVLAPTLVEVVQQSVSRFGKNNSVAFRVGHKVVGHVR